MSAGYPEQLAWTILAYSAGISGRRSAAELWAYVFQVGSYSPTAWLPHTVQLGRAPRANSSKYGPQLHASMAVQLVGFAAVFALAGGGIIHLPAPGRQRPRVFTAD